MNKVTQITAAFFATFFILCGQVAYAIDTNWDVTAYDGVGDSPSFVARDQSGNEARITKLNGGGTEIRSTEGPISLKPSGNSSNYISAETTSANPSLYFKNALSNAPGVRLNDGTGQLNVRDKNATTWQNLTWAVSTKSSDFSIATTDDKTFFLVTNQATATLPSAATVGAGFLVSVKRTGAAHTVSVNATGGQVIDGYARVILSTQYAKVTLISDGSNWYRVDTYGSVNPSYLTCPTGYVDVPANNLYVINNFCVAKYEMKNVGGVATSQALLTPWVSINQTSASMACSALGAGYHLISNNEWMTIARNIESTGQNWSGGAAGSGALNNGHSDDGPGNALAANSDDTQGCDGTGQTCSNSVWSSQRRTFYLSTGDVLWDLGGDVWEWINWNVPNTDKANPFAGWVQINASVPTGSMPQTSFYPANAAYTSTQGIGQYYPGTSGSGGAARRGGRWNIGTGAGAFSLDLGSAASGTHADVGFRCAFAPGS